MIINLQDQLDLVNMMSYFMTDFDYFEVAFRVLNFILNVE